MDPEGLLSGRFKRGTLGVVGGKFFDLFLFGFATMVLMVLLALANPKLSKVF
jgi:hypothetical protein